MVRRLVLGTGVWCRTAVVGAVLWANVGGGSGSPETGWKTDRALDAAVRAAGLTRCTIPEWGRTDGGDAGTGFNFSAPTVIPTSTPGVPWWNAGGAQKVWHRDEFLRAHGDSMVSVRLPAGQRQSGLLTRRATLRAIATESRRPPAGTEPGVVLDRTPQSVLVQAAGLRPPEPLLGANLTASVLSLGLSGTGLPLHNHGAAWLTVVAGAKLVVLTPPRSSAEPPGGPTDQAFLRLQHVSPVSWATQPRNRVSSTFAAAGVQPLACVLRPGDTVFIPCNWYHATLNIGDTLAVGGQQPDGSAHGAVPCPSDRDAEANVQFLRATAAIRRAAAATDPTEATRLLAVGEVLLQQSLSAAPLRVDAWLWRIHATVARGDAARAQTAAVEAADQIEAAAAAGWTTALRAMSAMTAVARVLPPSGFRTQLVRRIEALDRRGFVLDDAHVYGDSVTDMALEAPPSGHRTLREVLRALTTVTRPLPGDL